MVEATMCHDTSAVNRTRLTLDIALTLAPSLAFAHVEPGTAAGFLSGCGVGRVSAQWMDTYRHACRRQVDCVARGAGAWVEAEERLT
jgi:hypothetical protein